ncbi:hypothetical protein AAFF_G00371610 [Aldrovandia affinis]|uniref:Reverse transcriptase domain-containing protein n=1 Tax=Aldrovandia affinis TaxID=143900 RepID=A0AAD7WM99_9TELE|nr:hypothetical protein AAFF_G00371610 [Aldrovandia affinis]
MCLGDISGRVVVNKHLSAPFDIRSGVRQGCPLAPLLYVIYLEPFPQAIRRNKNIRGYLLPNLMKEEEKGGRGVPDMTSVILAQGLAALVQNILGNRLLLRSPLTTERVLYGPREGCGTPELQRQWRIINTVKQVLWEARDIKVFQEQTVDLLTLRRRLQNLLQGDVLVDFLKEERGARRKWGVSHWKELIIWLTPQRRWYANF